ncbi:hypothetical protein U9M48_020703 [Paspalum notatum var. saurae]|uniref:Replication protein A 70 kDa DNA-binding subunit B/D first OB fold domain-containing protein n=1 Tax=Paspalum notatum var. saurae TaxID=547442 RepID=A0AAQ3WSQ1_PASNO
MLCKSSSLHQASLGLGMRTSLSPQGTPGGPSQGRFTPLSRLTRGVHRWSTVLVRVSRIWVASDPIKGNEFGLDSLLIDGEGVTMQARAKPGDMERLKQLLVEGKVYAMSNFTVDQSLKAYMACRNGLMIHMNGETVVEEINDGGTGSSIPRHSFEFVDFGDVPSKTGPSIQVDFLGELIVRSTTTTTTSLLVPSKLG